MGLSFLARGAVRFFLAAVIDIPRKTNDWALITALAPFNETGSKSGDRPCERERGERVKNNVAGRRVACGSRALLFPGSIRARVTQAAGAGSGVRLGHALRLEIERPSRGPGPARRRSPRPGSPLLIDSRANYAGKSPARFPDHVGLGGHCLQIAAAGPV